jgi:hypothetical protein
MSHENSLGVVTGLVLVASVLAMISSVERVSHTLRTPSSPSGQGMSLASYEAVTVPAPAAAPSCPVMLPLDALLHRRN